MGVYKIWPRIASDCECDGLVHSAKDWPEDIDDDRPVLLHRCVACFPRFCPDLLFLATFNRKTRLFFNGEPNQNPAERRQNIQKSKDLVV